MDIQAYIQSGVIESYVLGVADAQDVAELQRLRAEYPEVEAAIAACEAWLAATARNSAVPVPDNVKEQLQHTLQNEFAPAADTTNQTSLLKRMNRVRYFAAASIVLLVASATINVYLYQKYHQANKDYIALMNERNTVVADNGLYQTKLRQMQDRMQLMAAPGMLKVSMPGTPGKEGNLVTLFWDTNTKDVYVLANKLPKAPAGKQYQLWALVDGKPVDAGMLGDCTDLCQLKPVLKAQAFAITLENTGGSPTPHLDQLYVMGNVRS